MEIGGTQPNPANAKGKGKMQKRIRMALPAVFRAKRNGKNGFPRSTRGKATTKVRASGSARGRASGRATGRATGKARTSTHGLRWID